MMMPDFLRTPVLASYTAELVAALFAAAVTLSFRRAFARADLSSWGAAWAASTMFAGLGIVAHTFPWSASEVTALRMVGRSGALLQAALLLRAAHVLTTGEVPRWLRRWLFLVPILAAASALASAGALRGGLELPSRAFASLAVGAASLAASARLLRARPARPGGGLRLMAVGLGFYGVMKVFSPMTLGRLGLLHGGFAGEALFLGFSLAPSTFALGCVVSLLEDRERVLAEERDRLRVSEEKFGKLFRLSPDPILLVRPLAGGVIVDVNESFVALSGYSRAQVIGQTGVGLGWLGADQRAELLQQVLASVRIRDREMTLSTPQGPRIFSLSVESIEIDGELHALSIARDVTERRLAEERLRRSEELFRAVVEDQTEMIVRWKPDGTRSFVNPAYCRVFGGSAADHVGSSFLPLVAAEHRDALQRKIASLTPAQPVATHVHESMAAAGRRWQEWTDRGIFDEAGRLLELQSTGRDVTERLRSEGRLRESEQRLRLALEAARMGIWEWDPASGTAAWSPRVEQIIGLLPSSALAAAGQYLEHVHPPDRAPLERLMAEALLGSRDGFSSEHRVRGDDGVLRWVEARAKSFVAAEGHVVLKGTVVDISERKQAEQALRLSEERLRRMSEATFEGIAFSENGVVFDANEQLARLLGYSHEELIGKTVEDLVVPAHRALVAGAMARQETSPYEHLAMRKDGATLLVETRGRALELGGHTLRVTAIRDVSERAELAERLGLIARATNDAVWDWDLKTGAVWRSDAMQTQFGYGPRQCQPELGWWSERVHPEDRQGVEAGLRAAIEGEAQTWSAEYRFQRADLSFADVLDRGFVLRSPAGAPLRMIGAMLDVTEAKRVQEALRRSERMAAVGRLVAGVAHEVRTPLFSISATLDAYEGQLDDPRERRAFLELLRSQVQRLSGLMHDLLDYGRPAALKLERGEIRSVIERAAGSCASLAREAGVRVEAETGPAADFELLHDPDRLEQVFQNLLSNAIHHAPRGSVVRIRTARLSGPEPALQCTIEDAGPGLRPDDLGKVFEPFFSRRKGGIGLGLAIVQRIVEEHGGSVRAANRPEGGASFSVMLAAPRARAA